MYDRCLPSWLWWSANLQGRWADLYWTSKQNLSNDLTGRVKSVLGLISLRSIPNNFISRRGLTRPLSCLEVILEKINNIVDKKVVWGKRYEARCSGAPISWYFSAFEPAKRSHESTTAWIAVSFLSANTRYAILQLSGLGRALQSRLGANSGESSAHWAFRVNSAT